MKWFGSQAVKWGLFMVLLALLVGLYVFPIFANENEEPTYMWDDAVLTFGVVTVGVGVLVRTLIQLGKAIQINGKPLFPTEGSIHLANVLLGGVLFGIVNLLNGASVPVALLQSVLAFFTAIGGHDLVDFLQSAIGGKSKGSSEDPKAPSGGVTR